MQTLYDAYVEKSGIQRLEIIFSKNVSIPIGSFDFSVFNVIWSLWHSDEFVVDSSSLNLHSEIIEREYGKFSICGIDIFTSRWENLNYNQRYFWMIRCVIEEAEVILSAAHFELSVVSLNVTASSQNDADIIMQAIALAS